MNFLIAALLTLGAPACNYEDGSGQRVCVWQANEAGNRVGHSALIWKGGTDDARARLISHRIAAKIIAAN